MTEEIRIVKAYEPPPKKLSAPAMSGWKTKWGSILLVVGTTIMGASDIAPSLQLGEWMDFIGTIATGAGTSLTAWGLGHKLEKNKTNIQLMQKAPKTPSSAIITKE